MSASQPVLQQPLTVLKGVGPQVAEKLKKLGLHSIENALFHFPLRYEDRTRITPIGRLRLHQDALVAGTIVNTRIVFGKRRSLLCQIADDSGQLNLRLFHFSAAQKQQLQTGKQIVCYAEARRGTSGLEFYHPEYHVLKEGEQPRDYLSTSLTPIYPATEGLSQKILRKVIYQALDYSNTCDLPSLLDVNHQALSSQSSLLKTVSESDIKIKSMLEQMHRPQNPDEAQYLQNRQHPCQQLLALEELCAFELNLLLARQQIKSRPAMAFAVAPDLQAALLSNLPFAMTGAQQRVSEDIAVDLQQPAPMYRLVQGDVGSGKTLVAALAALQVIAANSQVALMAPTEILAEQHYRNFQQWFEPLGIELAFLSGSQANKAKKNALMKIASGEAKMIIGTHALFQEGVEFSQLALVIIDEQHRFGVQQRLALSAKGQRYDQYPHQLIMTATPIPRTLAMSLYADLDCSVIDELPAGRTPINTVLVDQHRRGDVLARVQAACGEGRQAYWVCTLIEDSEELQCEAAETTAAKLEQELGELNIGLVHGRQKAQQKQAAMNAFKAGEIDVLVATTVIEVGVDVPNASLMIIENPERLGLSQLHQLRGRVGRGSTQSHCVLLYAKPLSAVAKQRLSVMRASSDGFVIAEQDLALRGPGEFLGTQQTGEIQFRLADLERDVQLLEQATEIAKALQQATQGHEGGQQGASDLAAALLRRWQPEGSEYAQA